MTPALKSTARRAPEIAAAGANHVLARHGRSFYWASHLLSAQHASRAARLYRLCRHIDDLADENSCVASARSALASVAGSMLSGRSPDPLIQDGIALLQECRIDPAVMLALIHGVSSDLALVRMADEASLIRYCYQVAGTVGLMMCQVLDTSDAAACAHAIDLGIAMQLTNICRDVKADALLGRRYLPASLVGALAPEALIDPSDALRPLLQRSVATLLRRADDYYRSGESGLAFLPLRARYAILVAARVYHAIGSRIRARDHAYWQGRVVVSGSSKVRITARTLCAAPFRRMPWQAAPAHDASLHVALAGMLGADVPAADVPAAPIAMVPANAA